MKMNFTLLFIVFFAIIGCTKEKDNKLALITLAILGQNSCYSDYSQTSISFIDEDEDFKQIQGEIRITGLPSGGFHVYWGNALLEMVNDEKIADTWIAGACQISYQFPENTVIPIGASHFLLYDTAGNYTGINAQIIDTDKSDPLFNQQWHLVNTGQKAYSLSGGTKGFDINLGSLHRDGYSGKGVIVAVVDSGLEIAHEDLKDNVVSGSWDFLFSDTDPTNISTDGDHGTSVAGLIAATGFNSKGGRGVAPSASLKGFNYILWQTPSNHIASLGGSSSNPKSSDVAIFNMSYGYDKSYDFTINESFLAHIKTMTDPVTGLRNGNGAIYIKAAGNGFGNFTTSVERCYYANLYGLSCQNSNMDPINATPYFIIVGALTAKGKATSYSTAGSSVLISAPAGEDGWKYPAMITTDQSNCTTGYSKETSTDNDLQAGVLEENAECNYTSTFNGTSSATPIVSGIAALMLQANPNLTWRDVKHIFITTARQVDADKKPVIVSIKGDDYIAEPAWTTNAAGYKFHNQYGFGMVDAYKAVDIAKSYTSSLGTFTSEESELKEFKEDEGKIPDNTIEGKSDSIVIAQNLTIEAVQITVSAEHNWLGDLSVELTSPSGTRSVLFTLHNGFYSGDDLMNMVLLSNAFYGEKSSGSWTIKVVDGFYGYFGKLTNWKITVYGHE